MEIDLNAAVRDIFFDLQLELYVLKRELRDLREENERLKERIKTQQPAEDI